RQKTTVLQNTIGHFGTLWGIKMGKISQSFCRFMSISPFFHKVSIPPTPPSGTCWDIRGFLHKIAGIFDAFSPRKSPAQCPPKKRQKCQILSESVRFMSPPSPCHPVTLSCYHAPLSQLNP